MADFTKAGLDRGDIEAELKNLITSARSTFRAYLLCMEDLTPEEIKADYEMYLSEYENRVKPKVQQALDYKEEKITRLAQEYERLYVEFLKTLEEKIFC